MFGRSKILFALAALAAFFVVASCEPKTPDVPEEEGETSVAIYKGKALVDSKAGSQFIIVQAPGAWILSVECADGGKWATLSQTSGEGSKNNIILSYEENKSEDARVVTVTLRYRSDEAVCSLTQAGVNQSGNKNNGVSSTQKGWMELPATSENDGLDFFTHIMKVGSSDFRNFSYYWDYTNFVSHWVAYPLNKTLRGSGGRSDAWALDPNLPEAEQSNITMRGFRPYGYDRGHQCPSADRLTNVAANMQTFYGTNMTPQLSDFNQNLWASLEGRVRSWGDACDTLYVVTGCVVAPNSTSGAEGAIGGYAWDNVQNKVAIPKAYYKAVLRYSKTSNVGWGGYAACAIYLEHKNYGSSAFINKSMSMSIDELEKLTGVDFFVNLPAAIGKEDADKVEAQNPQNVGLWW